MAWECGSLGLFDERISDSHGITQRIDRRTVYARAMLKVLNAPDGIETLDWQLADAAIQIADIELNQQLRSEL